MKTRLFFLLTFSAIITVVSCRNSGNDSGNAVQIAVEPQKGVLSMSSLYDGYKIVIPEGMLVSGITDVILLDSSIAVLGDTDAGMISIFDMDGRYIRSFLTRGRGPGEMTDVTAIAYNDFNNTLDVLGNYGMDIYCYDLISGRLVRNFSLDGSEIMYAKDFIPIDAESYLFYKDLSYIDGEEFEVYRYNSAQGSVTGRFLPLDKDFAEAASFAQGNNLFRYNGSTFFYSAFSDGIYEFDDDTLRQSVKFADNGYNFTTQMKSRPYAPDLMKFVEMCQNSGRIWGHVDLYRIGKKTISVYNYKKDRYGLIMDLDEDHSKSYDSIEDDLVFGVASDSFFVPYYLRYTDENHAVYLVEPYDILELAADFRTDDTAILKNREYISSLPYESNQMILIMSIRK